MIKKKKAINNNMGLYEAIFKANGFDLLINEEVYYLKSTSLPLYSNLVTRSKDWIPDDLFKSIANKLKGIEWSIKDSFGCLDLTNHGFSKLFDAKWFYIDKGDLDCNHSKAQFKYKIVEREEELVQWITTWGEGEDIGNQIFNKSLSPNPQVDMINIEDVTGLASVAILNRTEEVIGISNFSPKEEIEKHWLDLICFIQNEYGPIDIVGYEQQDIINEIKYLGVEPVGDWTVWLKRASVSL